MTGLETERKFLELVRYHYGYADDIQWVARSDDPRDAVRYWAIQNGRINGNEIVIPAHGTLKIKRHSFPFASASTYVSKAVEPLGEDAAYRYQLFWSCYVIAWDKKTNEWFVLFVPPHRERALNVHSDGKLLHIETAFDASTPSNEHHGFTINLDSLEY